MDNLVLDKLSKIVYDKAGIKLGTGKEALVSSRIAKRIRLLGLDSERAYLKHLVNDETGAEIVELLDVISTNVTSFYREADHFDFLASEMKKWIVAGQKRFRVWCAASSTGEEPYTIAMTLLEAPTSERLDMKILATDISTKVLRHAIGGTYPISKMGGVSSERMKKFFVEAESESGELAYSASEQMKSMTSFRRLNLNEPPYPMHGPLDVVFCRNVMIYFDNTVRTRLLKEVERLLKPGGILFVGHSESLTGILCGLKTVRPSVYIKQ